MRVFSDFCESIARDTLFISSATSLERLDESLIGGLDASVIQQTPSDELESTTWTMIILFLYKFENLSKNALSFSIANAFWSACLNPGLNKFLGGSSLVTAVPAILSSPSAKALLMNSSVA